MIALSFRIAGPVFRISKHLCVHISAIVCAGDNAAAERSENPGGSQAENRGLAGSVEEEAFCRVHASACYVAAYCKHLECFVALGIAFSLWHRCDKFRQKSTHNIKPSW